MKIDRLKTMQSRDELPTRVCDTLKSIDKDIEWLADRMTVSVETVRAWSSGKQPIPENKRMALEAFVLKHEGVTISGGKPRTPKSPKVIINLT